MNERSGSSIDNDLGPSASPSGLLDSTTKKILKVEPYDYRARCARALKASITPDMDSDDGNQCASPMQIQLDLGVSIDDQVALGISLTKKSALDFIARMRVDDRDRGISKAVSAKRYLEVLKREVSRSNRKSLVFTYSEVLLLRNRVARIDFPPDLQEYVND